MATRALCLASPASQVSQESPKRPFGVGLWADYASRTTAIPHLNAPVHGKPVPYGHEVPRWLFFPKLLGRECRERRKGAFLPSPWYASTPPCSPCSAHAAESREKTARNRRKNHTHWYVPVQLLGCLKRAYFWLPREEPSSIAQRENFIDRKEVRFPIWKAYSALTPGQGLCPQASRHTTRNTQLAISTAQQSYSSPQREIFSLSEKGFYKSIQNAYSTPARSQPGFGSGLSGNDTPPFSAPSLAGGRDREEKLIPQERPGKGEAPLWMRPRPPPRPCSRGPVLVPSYFRFFPYGKVCRFARSPSSRPSSLRSES